MHREAWLSHVPTAVLQFKRKKKAAIARGFLFGINGS
jgi:hypothetical protein